MVLLHFYGSSHFSEKRGLPDVVLEAYKNTGDAFKERYFPSWFIYAPGGKLFDEDLLECFVSAAQDCVTEPGYYEGQICVLCLGSNDWKPGVKIEDFEAQYRHFVDRLLQVEHTAVLVTSLIPRENTDMSIPNKMLEKMVQSYKAENAKVGYVKTLKSALSPGNGNPQDGRNVRDGALERDGVHMAQDTVAAVVKQIIENIRQIPRSWFPDWLNY